MRWKGFWRPSGLLIECVIKLAPFAEPNSQR